MQYDTGKNYADDPAYMEYYRATGMKTMFFQAIQYQQTFVESGQKEYFNTSALKVYMDMAAQAGITRGIVLDWRLLLLSSEKVNCLYKTDDLVDKVWTYSAPNSARMKEISMQLALDTSTFQFETKSEFKNYVVCCLKEYESHSIFAGVMLRDEPTYQHLNASADVHKIIREYNPDITVVQNLFPMYADKSYLCEVTTGKTQEQCYTEYVNAWFDKTGADYFMCDSYPIKNAEIEPWHIKGLRLAAEICEERNADLSVVMQTSAMKFDGELVYRQCEEADLYWQTNMALGFGADKIIYYTYFAPANSLTSTDGILDGSGFMDFNGQKTELYHSMTNIMTEMNAIAPVITNFKYNASATIGYNVSVDYDFDSNDSFQAVSAVYVQQGDLALVTELYDSEKGNYLYMVQNVIDPANSGDTTINVDLVVDGSYGLYVIYTNGTPSYRQIKGGTISVELTAGSAVFIMPY